MSRPQDANQVLARWHMSLGATDTDGYRILDAAISGKTPGQDEQADEAEQQATPTDPAEAARQAEAKALLEAMKNGVSSKWFSGGPA